MIILNSYFFKNTNLANWFILAFLSALFLQSCTTPQSVGYNMKSKNPQKNKSTEPTIVPIVTDNPQSKTEFPQQVNDRLPTLREQMKMIADKQASIEVDVDIIKSEISLIKAEIVDLKTSLLTDGKIVPKQIVTGESNSKQKRNLQKQVEEETYILPDEAAVKDNKKSNQPNNTPVNFKPPQKGDNKQSKNTINKDEKQTPLTQNTEKLIPEPKQTEPSMQQPETTLKDNEAYEKVKLAQSLVNSGKVEEAKKIYKEILKQNPKNELTPIAKKMLQQL